MNEQKLKDQLAYANIELVKAKSALQMMIETMEPEAIEAQNDDKKWATYFCERTAEVFVPMLHLVFDGVCSALQLTDLGKSDGQAS